MQSPRSSHPRTQEAIGWMASFFDLMGDRMPNNVTLHLPSSTTKLQIYQRMLDDMSGRGKAVIISQSHFFDIWKRNFDHVLIPKV